MTQSSAAKRTVGRYEVYAEISSGGMATVHLGRQLGHVGFSRTVAIKRLHPHIAREPEFVEMFLDEARLATRIQNPHVVTTLDVVAADGELLLVMEHVHGESLAKLLGSMAQRKERMDPRIAVAVGVGILEGLHAAHEAKNELGVPLEIVHRDVSPQNVLVGADGVARVFDFGIAKAADRLHTTQDGSIKGKIAYMSPEQLENELVDRRSDVWAASVVIWEMLAGRRLFVADAQAALVRLILTKVLPPPSGSAAPSALDRVVMRGLSKDPRDRFSTARAMALALEEALPSASASARAVATWVGEKAKDALAARGQLLEELERAAAGERPSGATRIEFNALLGGSGPEGEVTEARRGPPVAANAEESGFVQEDATTNVVNKAKPPQPMKRTMPTAMPTPEPRLERTLVLEGAPVAPPKRAQATEASRGSHAAEPWPAPPPAASTSGAGTAPSRPLPPLPWLIAGMLAVLFVVLSMALVVQRLSRPRVATDADSDAAEIDPSPSPSPPPSPSTTAASPAAGTEAPSPVLEPPPVQTGGAAAATPAPLTQPTPHGSTRRTKGPGTGPGAPGARCTPLDFDYPACLKR